MGAFLGCIHVPPSALQLVHTHMLFTEQSDKRMERSHRKPSAVFCPNFSSVEVLSRVLRSGSSRGGASRRCVRSCVCSDAHSLVRQLQSGQCCQAKLCFASCLPKDSSQCALVIPVNAGVLHECEIPCCSCPNRSGFCITTIPCIHID